MHTSMIKSRHLGSASIAVALLAASATWADVHNHHSNDISEPVSVTLNVDATATAGGESQESAPSFGSYNHPIIATDNLVLGSSSQAGGGIMSSGSAQIDAKAQVMMTQISDDLVRWDVACEETGELSGGSAGSPVSTSFDITSALWYTVDLQEAQDIVFTVRYHYYSHTSLFFSEEDTMVVSGSVLAWDGAEPSVSGPASFASVSEGHYLNVYGEVWYWRISLPAGRWRLQATFNGAHIHESVTSEVAEKNIEYSYQASLRPSNPSYLLPDRVNYLEQGGAMLTASTSSEEKSDSDSVNQYNEAVQAGLGGDYMIAPWAYSDITATQYDMFWDDQGFYQTLDAHARFGADTAHPFQTSTIRGEVTSQPKLIMGTSGKRFEVSFSTEVVNEAWAVHKYHVEVTVEIHPEHPIEEIEPYWVSGDGRRFRFSVGNGNVSIRPLIELSHSLTAQGSMVESEPHEFVTMRVKFPFRSDLNSDGLVDGSDLATLLAKWGVEAIEADLNGDGVVNGEDLGIMLSEWS